MSMGRAAGFFQKAVELEVTEFLGRDHYQRHRENPLRGYRNGYVPIWGGRLRIGLAFS